jgi:hypothetical protein
MSALGCILWLFIDVFVIVAVCLRQLIMCSAVLDAFSTYCFTGLWLLRNRIRTKYLLAFLCKTHSKSGPFCWLKLMPHNVTVTLYVDEWKLRWFWRKQNFAIRCFSSPIPVQIIIWITLQDHKIHKMFKNNLLFYCYPFKSYLVVVMYRQYEIIVSCLPLLALHSWPNKIFCTKFQ